MVTRGTKCDPKPWSEKKKVFRIVTRSTHQMDNLKLRDALIVGELPRADDRDLQKSMSVHVSKSAAIHSVGETMSTDLRRSWQSTSSITRQNITWIADRLLPRRMLVGGVWVEDCSKFWQCLRVYALLVADNNDGVVEERLPERLLVFLGKLVEVEDGGFV